jgi:hypothetical protein
MGMARERLESAQRWQRAVTQSMKVDLVSHPMPLAIQRRASPDSCGASHFRPQGKVLRGALMAPHR